MVEKTKRPQPVDPVSLALSKKTVSMLSKRRVSRRTLAREIGWPYDEVKRYLNLGSKTGYKEWPAKLREDVARYFGCRPDQLAGAPGPGDHIWDPRSEDAAALFARFAEHQERSPFFLAFNRILPCSVMTPSVQRQHHYSLFEPLLDHDEGLRMVEAYDDFGTSRREAFLENGLQAPDQFTTLMLRSDFEKLVARQRPFDLCRPSHVVSCLDYLRTECVRNRDYRLLLIHDRKLSPRLNFQLALDSLIVIAKTMSVRRTGEYTIPCSDNPQVVAQDLKTLTELSTLIDYEVSQATILREIEMYLRKAEEYAS